MYLARPPARDTESLASIVLVESLLQIDDLDPASPLSVAPLMFFIFNTVSTQWTVYRSVMRCNTVYRSVTQCIIHTEYCKGTVVIGHCLD